MCQHKRVVCIIYSHFIFLFGKNQPEYYIRKGSIAAPLSYWAYSYRHVITTLKLMRMGSVGEVGPRSNGGDDYFATLIRSSPI